MAGKSIVGMLNGVNGAFVTSSNNLTWFQHPSQSSFQNSTAPTEAQMERTCRKDATARNLSVKVNLNARGTNTTVRLRVNGAKGNQVVTIAGGATGWFVDSSNEDSLVDGDTFCFSIATGGSPTASININAIFCEFESDSGNAHTYVGRSDANFYSATGNTQQWYSVGGLSSTASSSARETNAGSFSCAGTLSNMELFVLTNARTTNTPVTLEINGTTATLGITIPATTTGLFEDTSNSDSIAAGDYANISVAPQTTTGQSLQIRCCSMLFVGDADEVPLLAPDTSNAVGGTTNYGGMCGDSSPTATESAVQLQIPFDCTLFGVRARALFGSGGGSITVRINGANGNGTASTSSGSTQVIADNTNEDDVVAGDLINFNRTYVNTSNAHWSGLALRNPSDAAPTARRVVLLQGF